MAGSPPPAQHLRDLAWLRRVRDRMEWKDAQPRAMALPRRGDLNLIRVQELR